MAATKISNIYDKFLEPHLSAYSSTFIPLRKCCLGDTPDKKHFGFLNLQEFGIFNWEWILVNNFIG